MKKHWVHFLYNIGSIMKYKADEIVSLQNRVAEAEKKLLSLKRDLEWEENELFQTVREDWSIEEITDAKQRLKAQIQ